MKSSSTIWVLLLACSLPACLPTSQSTGGSAAHTGANKFGYRGSATDPAGFSAKPSAAPDGAIAQAMSPVPTAGVQAQADSKSVPPAGVAGSTISQAVLPTVNSMPPRPPDTGINPQVTKPAPPPPPARTSPQTTPTVGSTSTPPPPPAPATKPKNDYPYGIPVPGKDGMVYSPYDKEAGYVDVRGMKPGALVEDPYSKKYFRVP